MAIAKRSVGSPWMSAAVFFIIFTVIAAAVAVVLYINLEKQTKALDDLRLQQDEVITNQQWNGRSSLIGGQPPRGQTYVGALLGYVDTAVRLILGAPPQDVSAELKIESVNKQVTDFLATLNQDHPDIAAVDANTVGLLGMMQRLKGMLDASTQMVSALNAQLKDAEKLRQEAIEASDQKVKELTAQRDALAQQAQQVQTSYDKLKALMQKSTDQQVKTLITDLDNERQKSTDLNQQLLKTQAELKVAQEMLRDARDKLAKFTGAPATGPELDVADGEILLVDEYSKTVNINIGSQQHVYPGLTFGVYDRFVPIPADGKGKAEIQVFSVAKDMSTAKITQSDPDNPILKGDVIANLVWSKDKVNLFVVAGDFDLNGDGTIDPDAGRKIKALIENWGGKVEDAVSVNTSFVVLGTTPAVLERPTYDQLAVDPLAMQKYEASLKRLADYKEVLKQAQALNIPILNYERFLYLIGYKSQSTRPGAFSTSP
jgi:hypothetical protein